MSSSEHPTRRQGLDALAAGRYAEAFALLRPLAEAGDAEVQAHLGGMMLYGLHRFADVEAYNAWFMAASDAEHAAFAQEVQEEVTQAMQWLQNASDQGIGPASHNLAMAYLSGCGNWPAEFRPAKAKELLARARSQGLAFFGSAEGDEGYLRALEGYAAGQGISTPWEGCHGSGEALA